MIHVYLSVIFFSKIFISLLFLLQFFNVTFHSGVKIFNDLMTRQARERLSE
jgi:hypothetical protein